MMEPFWTKLIRRPFDWVQLAVTSHCNAACRYCPHTILRRHWQEGHLALKTLTRLAPDLQRINLLYLQGWGEPLLHPDFFNLVSLAKQHGCQVGTTTNGTLLTREMITRIIESRMDVLAFTLAGIGQTHNIWRPGTDYHQVLQAISDLQSRKRQLGRTTPRVHIAYLLLRSGLSDLERLPGSLQGLNLEQVVVSFLDLVLTPELARESLTGVDASEGAEIDACLDDLVAAGARAGLAIHRPPGHAYKPLPDCPENVGRAAVVSVTGEVSPCVFTNIPATAGIHYYRGIPNPLVPLSFGNLLQFPFRKIWNQPAYKKFRNSFRKKELTESCRSCLKLSNCFIDKTVQPGKKSTIW